MTAAALIVAILLFKFGMSSTLTPFRVPIELAFAVAVASLALLVAVALAVVVTVTDAALAVETMADLTGARFEAAVALGALSGGASVGGATFVVAI